MEFGFFERTRKDDRQPGKKSSERRSNPILFIFVMRWYRGEFSSALGAVSRWSIQLVQMIMNARHGMRMRFVSNGAKDKSMAELLSNCAEDSSTRIKIGKRIMIGTASGKAWLTSHGRNTLTRNVSKRPDSRAYHWADLNGAFSSCVWRQYGTEQWRGQAFSFESKQIPYITSVEN